MASYDNAYSRLVASLKVVLPLVALALLSTLFLFSRNIDPDRAIPYADVDVEELAREQRISAPAYSGMTGDGTAFTVSARRAQPDLANPRRMSANELTARLELEDGDSVDITSGLGLIDTEAGTAELTGGVVVETSTGYRIETQTLDADLDGTRLESTDSILATGPIGRLEAGQMVLSRDSDPGAALLLVFKNRVKLIYTPQE